MKKILFSLFLLLSITVSAQVVSSTVSYSQPASGGGGATYSDDFDALNAGALASQGDWITGGGTLTVADAGGGEMVVYPNTGELDLSVCIYDDTFADNQYSKTGDFTSVNSAYYMGVGVRLTGTGATLDGYGYAGGGTDAYIFKITDGSPATVGSAGDAVTSSDNLELRASGSTITAYRNGVVDTTVGTDGSITDSDYSSGKAGLVGYGTSAVGNYVPDWGGGDL